MNFERVVSMLRLVPDPTLTLDMFLVYQKPNPDLVTITSAKQESGNLSFRLNTIQ